MRRSPPTLLLILLAASCGPVGNGHDDASGPVPIDQPAYFEPDASVETEAIAFADLPDEQQILFLHNYSLALSIGSPVGAADVLVEAEYWLEVVARCSTCGPILLDHILVLSRQTVHRAGRPPEDGDVREVRTAIRPQDYRLLDRTAEVACGSRRSGTYELAFALPAETPAVCPGCQGGGTLDGSEPEGGWSRADRSAYLRRIVLERPAQIRTTIAYFESMLTLEPHHRRAEAMRQQMAYWRKVLAESDGD